MINKKIISQFIKFSVIGFLNTIINLAVLYMLTEFVGIYYLFSAVIAFIVAVTNSFIFNKIWTFNENINYKTKSRYIKFFIISISALLVNLSLLYILVEFFEIWYIQAQIIGIITNLLINFLGNKIWTFNE